VLRSLLDAAGDQVDLSADLSTDGGARFVVTVPKRDPEVLSHSVELAGLLAQLHV
jgi:hypothetical protein